MRRVFTFLALIACLTVCGSSDGQEEPERPFLRTIHDAAEAGNLDRLAAPIHAGTGDDHPQNTGRPCARDNASEVVPEAVVSQVSSPKPLITRIYYGLLHCNMKSVNVAPL